MRRVRTPTVAADAELEVLEPVVRSVAVLVVDRFVSVERSTEMFRHDEAVLHDPSVDLRHCKQRMVWEKACADVPVRHLEAATVLEVPMARTDPRLVSAVR